MMCRRRRHREHRPLRLAINLLGAAAVGFVLVINLDRGEPTASLAAALLIAAALHRL